MANTMIDKRIASEVKRLEDALSDISDEHKAAVDGLIRRVAFMRIQLEDLERDIIENGVTDLFTQSEKTAPYERRRPTTDVYISINKSYQTAVRQLNDLLPKDTPAVEEAVVDEFEDFVNGR